ncbi:superinfection immunity protein [Hymenobacter sp. BT491]|uniref:superinfection immunity protein n=1 Tax=Hymenobacter sp. BT491 TaxID=2766779 RepID=UPI00165353FC|nr:superinfection immunity protein [Hymenobacter sp. BT491]
MGTFGIIILAFFALVLYFLPALLASKKRNSTAIFWLNLLAGWTFLGWVGALIWSLMKDDPKPSTLHYPPAVTSADNVERYANLKRLRDGGLLTHEEFLQEVGKL